MKYHHHLADSEITIQAFQMIDSLDCVSVDVINLFNGLPVRYGQFGVSIIGLIQHNEQIGRELVKVHSATLTNIDIIE